MKKLKNIAKVLFIPGLMIGLIPYHSGAQTVKGQHEISAGIGYQSIYDLSGTMGDDAHNNYSLSFVYSASYRYHLSRRFSIGLNLARQRIINHDFMDGTRRYDHSDDRTFTMIAPEINYCYLARILGVNKNELRIYGLMSVGVAVIDERDKYGYRDQLRLPGLQLSPICVRYGRALAGYCELGLGSKGLVNAGVSYCFPKKGGKAKQDKTGTR